jgi:hypothetical protein
MSGTAQRRFFPLIFLVGRLFAEFPARYIDDFRPYAIARES